MKKPLVLLATLAGLVIFALAYLKAEDIYVGLTTSDRHVAARCSAGLTKELVCWCYAEYLRECPLGAAAE